MKDLYLVDGYNVIFGRPDIFDRSDLESCRKKLMDIMQDYGAHNDIEVIIAFDGTVPPPRSRWRNCPPSLPLCIHREG